MQIRIKGGEKVVKLDAAEKRSIAKALETIESVKLIDPKVQHLCNELATFQGVYCVETEPEPAKAAK